MANLYKYAVFIPFATETIYQCANLPMWWHANKQGHKSNGLANFLIFFMCPAYFAQITNLTSGPARGA